MSITVSSLETYPIKGCASVSHEEVMVTETGLEHDRRWVIVNQENKFLSQRDCPDLALIQPIIDGDELYVDIPSFATKPTSISKPEGSTVYDISIFDKKGTGISQSLELNALLSAFLGKRVKLLQVQQPRAVKPECQRTGLTSTIGFADAFPALLTNTASLANLNTYLFPPLSMDRFRSNITVSGAEAPAYDEDYWRQALIGQASAAIVRACARCKVPNVDQVTGRTDPRSPVTTALSQSRRGIDPVNGKPGVFFGQNVLLSPGARIAIGDELQVTERSTTRNFVLL